MLSFKTELKKAAVVIQSHASGHGGHVGGLGISLLNHKLLEDSLNKVAENQQQGKVRYRAQLTFFRKTKNFPRATF